MKKWPIKLLGDLCDVEGGNAAPQGDENFKNGTIPFVRMKDLGRPHFTNNLTETDDKLTEASASSNRMKFFDPGCILFPRSGSVALNHRAILGIRACVVSHIGVLQKLRPEITAGYLYLYLTTFDMTALSKKTTGVDSIAFADVKRIPVPVPPLAEQERIVKLLDEADELRKLRAQADKRAAKLLPALFEEMFGDPMSNPQKWPVRPVSSFVEELHGGRSVNPAGADEATGRYRVLKISAVTWGEFKPEESKPVTAGYEPPESHFVRAGDLLFSRANTTELVAATSYVFDTPPNLLLPDKLWRFVWKQPLQIEPRYVWWLFQAASIRRELGQRATGTGGSMKNISKPKVMTLEVPLPTLSLQKEFAQRVIEIRTMEAAQAASRERLEALFQALLHRAFTGEL